MQQTSHAFCCPCSLVHTCTLCAMWAAAYLNTVLRSLNLLMICHFVSYKRFFFLLLLFISLISLTVQDIAILSGLEFKTVASFEYINSIHSPLMSHSLTFNLFYNAFSPVICFANHGTLITVHVFSSQNTLLFKSKSLLFVKQGTLLRKELEIVTFCIPPPQSKFYLFKLYNIKEKETRRESYLEIISFPSSPCLFCTL